METHIHQDYILINEMDQTKQDDFARLVNEAQQELPEQIPDPADVEGRIAAEKRRDAVQALLSRKYTQAIQPCTNDCWLRAIVKLEGVYETDDGVYKGPMARVYCLPDNVVGRGDCESVLKESVARFDEFIARESDPTDFDR